MVPKLLAQMGQFGRFAESLDGIVLMEANKVHVVGNEAAGHKRNR